jgi:hypothetical protein
MHSTSMRSPHEQVMIRRTTLSPSLTTSIVGVAAVQPFGRDRKTDPMPVDADALRGVSEATAESFLP